MRNLTVLGLVWLTACSFSSSGGGQDGQPRPDAALGVPDAILEIFDASPNAPDGGMAADPCSLTPGGLLFCLPFGALLDQDNDLAIDGSTNQLNAEATAVSVATRLTAGDALSLAAVSQVYVDNNSEFDVDDSVSFGAFVQIGTLPDEDKRFVIIDHNVSYVLSIPHSGSVNCSVFNDAGDAISVQSDAVPLDAWFHAMCVASPEKLSVYINGVFVRSIGRGTPHVHGGTDGLCVGRNCTTGGSDTGNNASQLLGDLDNVKIWNRVLMPDEVCKEAGQIDCPGS